MERCHYWVCSICLPHSTRWTTIYYSTEWNPRLASAERSCRGFAHSYKVERNRCILEERRPMSSRSLPVFLKEVSSGLSSSSSTQQTYHSSQRSSTLTFIAMPTAVSLYFHERAELASFVVANFSACIAEIKRWMASNRLKLNPDKTQFIWMGTWQQLAKVDSTSVALGSTTLECQSTVNNLGVTIDSQLTMKDHVRRTCIACFYQLRQLRVVRRSLSSDACASLVHAFISSRLDYCNSLLAGISDTLTRQLQSVLRVAARLVTKTRNYNPISEIIRDKLHWLPVRQRIDFKLGVLVYKCLHNEAPPYLMEMVLPVSHIPGRRMLRSSARGDVVGPRTESVRLGPRGFSSAGPSLCNSLPTDLKVADLTFNVFKKTA